jgi:hypothetical protein
MPNVTAETETVEKKTVSITLNGEEANLLASILEQAVLWDDDPVGSLAQDLACQIRRLGVRGDRAVFYYDTSKGLFQAEVVE